MCIYIYVYIYVYCIYIYNYIYIYTFREAKTSPRSVGSRSVWFIFDRKNLYKSFSIALIPQKSETTCLLKGLRFFETFGKVWDR